MLKEVIFILGAMMVGFVLPSETAAIVFWGSILMAASIFYF
jgi:hypothetical protein